MRAGSLIELIMIILSDGHGYLVPEPMHAIPKVSLIQSPTPLHRLERVSADLGIELWIKRDDLTGFAMGGNKGRKLEYLLAQAIFEGAQAVVTCGSLQSNFIRHLAAACAVHGLQCAAAVMDTPYEHTLPFLEGLKPENGNLALNSWLGVDIHKYPDGTWDELFQYKEDVAGQYERDGTKVFRIPVGGSSPLGAYAFFLAGKELSDQAETSFDTVITASSSGSTQVGLTYHFSGSDTQVLGIAADPEPELASDFAELGVGLAALIGVPALPVEAFNLNFDGVGPGYGIPSEEGNDAIRYLAQKEGIFLDPIYSGKAFGVLLKLAREGGLTGRTCFWHTGGTPALFAMA